MLKKSLFCAILGLQFAVISNAAADLPNPPCPPGGCPASRVAADLPNPPCPPGGCPIIPQ
jgi:hypothetical protein